MKLTSKGQYAISAMLYLAVNEQNGPVSLMTIAKQLGISISYSEQLFGILREHGLVKGMRGPGGGYTICKAFNEISLGQIIDAVDMDTLQGAANKQAGEEEVSQAPITNTIKKADTCSDLWCEVSGCIREFLYNIDLQTFLNRDSVQALLKREPSGSVEMAELKIA